MTQKEYIYLLNDLEKEILETSLATDMPKKETISTLLILNGTAFAVLQDNREWLLDDTYRPRNAYEQKILSIGIAYAKNENAKEEDYNGEGNCKGQNSQSQNDKG